MKKQVGSYQACFQAYCSGAACCCSHRRGAGAEESPAARRDLPAVSSVSAPFMAVFREGLHDLGYTEGKNIVIEERYADGKEDRLPALAAELVHLKVDIIMVAGGNATLAAKNATKTVPIVMGTASDPVGTGLAARGESGRDHFFID